MTFRIAISGAGVAGSLVALGLAGRRDVAVSCFERVARGDQSEAGTGLNIGPNAIKALATMDAALADELIAAGLPWRSWKISLTDGTPLFDLDLARVADNPGIRIRWSELYSFLRSRLDDTVRFEADVHGARDAAGGGIELEVETAAGLATHGPFDLVIAADGRYSILRERSAGKPLVRHLGVAISRLLIPALPGCPVDDYEQWFNGPNRLLAFQVPTRQLYVATTFPLLPGAEIPLDLKRPAALRALYTPAEGAPDEKARFLIDAICDHAGSFHWARIQEADALFRDATGRLLFLGDAAHPMAPTLGQGATQAIEDAVAAVGAIRAALDAGAPSAAAITAAVARARLDRVRWVQRFSWEASDTLLPHGDPVAGSRAKLEPAFREKLAVLYRDCARADEVAPRA